MSDDESRSPSPSPSTDSESQETTTTFTLFAQLPPLIRERIWRHAAKQPRDIEVAFTLKHWWSSQGSPSEKTPQFTSVSPIPAVLHACGESRNEGLKIFKRCFEVEVEEEPAWHEIDDSGSESSFEDYDSSSESSFKRSYSCSEEGSRPHKKRKAVSSKQTRNERCIYINPDIDTLFVVFPDWAFYHWQSIQEVFVYDRDLDDDPRDNSSDFLSTWTSTRIDISMGVWNADHIYDGCRHFVLCFQQHRLKAGGGMITKHKELSRRQKWLEPKGASAWGRIVGWDSSWEEVVRMLQCWHLGKLPAGLHISPNYQKDDEVQQEVQQLEKANRPIVNKKRKRDEGQQEPKQQQERAKRPSGKRKRADQ